MLAHGAVGDGLADDTAAFNAATTASGKSSVYVPPGTYNLGAVTLTRPVKFAEGVTLKPTAGQTILFNATRQRIEGVNIALTAASSSTWTAVEVRGAGSLVDGINFDVSDDIPNCTLFKVTGARARVADLRIASAGKAFKYGLHVISSDGSSELRGVTVEGLNADVGDDGAAVSFQALLYARSTRSKYRHIQLDAGGRATFVQGVVVNDGHFNTFEDPFIAAPLANYGVYCADGAEFCYIRGGWIQAVAGSGWLTNSEGIYVGHNCDHLSLKDVTVTGWDYGLGFHGSNNIPNLDGFDSSNNQTAAILIDSKIGADDWPVSGLTLTAPYAENAAAGSQPIYIWAKTGQVLGGCIIGGGSLGYETYFIKIETAFAAFAGFTIDGNRIIALNNTGAGILANATTDILWGKGNDTERSNTIASGAFASKVRTLVDSATTTYSMTSLTLGSGGTTLTKYLSDVYTANFGNIPANTEVALEFTLTGIAITDAVFVTYSNALLAKDGIVYKDGITTTNKFGVTARNVTGSTINTVTGSIRGSCVKH